MVTTCDREISEKTYEKLCKVIPGGVNSPVRAFKSLGQTPLVAERGKNDLIYDVDGNSYIDYCGSWGALIHGHAHPSIVKAAVTQMEKGSTFGVTTSLEEKIASKVIRHFPSIEKIRFVSSGTEATMSAIRLARGFTGRDLLVKFDGNYHGHADHLLIKAGSGVFGLTPTSSSSGVPKDFVKHTACLPYNDVEACRKFFRDPANENKIAAVILEPIAGNMGFIAATREFIQMLREETQRIGAVLIFDEVITGFRVGLNGAQALYNVVPDLTCLGKIIGGGFPAAAFGGREEIMNCLAPLGTVYQAGTLSGNPVAMAAGLEALTLLEQPGFYEELECKTRILCDPIQKSLQQNEINGSLQRQGSMFTIFFGRRSVSNMEEASQLDQKTFVKFFKYMFERGIYFPPMQQEVSFISSVHEDKHLLQTAEAVLDFIEML